MSAPLICADCGLPIVEPHISVTLRGVVRHADWLVCLSVLKADRDRYRAALVSLRDAERAYTEARAARNAAYRASRGCATTEFIEAARVCNAAGDALDAAIAAVEEG